MTTGTTFLLHMLFDSYLANEIFILTNGPMIGNILHLCAIRHSLLFSYLGGCIACFQPYVVPGSSTGPAAAAAGFSALLSGTLTVVFK